MSLGMNVELTLLVRDKVRALSFADTPTRK